MHLLYVKVQKKSSEVDDLFELISKYAEYLETASFLSYPISLFLGFLAGISAITCYLPLIPALMGFVGGQDFSQKKLFLFPFYVTLGSILVLGSLGVIVSLFGMTVQTYVGSAWKYFVGTICIIVALFMLKAIRLPELKLPNFQFTGFWTPLLVGMVVGLAMGFGSSCCTPTLPIVLTYAGIQANPVHGGLVLSCFAVGQSIPIFAIGIFSSALGKLAAKWSKIIRIISGVLLIAAGIYFIIWG